MRFPTDKEIATFVAQFTKDRMAAQAKRGMGLDVSLGAYSEGYAHKRQIAGRSTSPKRLTWMGNMLTQMQMQPRGQGVDIRFTGETPASNYIVHEDKHEQKTLRKESNQLGESVPNRTKAFGTNEQSPWIGLGPEGAKECAAALARWIADYMRKS